VTLDAALRQQIRMARDQARRQRIALEDAEHQVSPRSLRTYKTRAPTRCVGCGAEHGDNTLGCRRCKDRTRRRNQRRAQAAA
jgi:DnaJ-class molecular chaperone